MKKPAQPRLALRRETVILLTRADLPHLVGGLPRQSSTQSQTMSDLTSTGCVTGESQCQCHV